MFDCHNCKRPVSFPAFLRARWATPQPHRCPWCGTVHAVLNGQVDVISPFPLPIGEGCPNRWMPWQLPYTRPIKPGRYECRFRSIEPVRLILEWDGRHFRHDGKRVSMVDFLSWRGEWM